MPAPAPSNPKSTQPLLWLVLVVNVLTCAVVVRESMRSTDRAAKSESVAEIGPTHQNASPRALQPAAPLPLVEKKPTDAEILEAAILRALDRPVDIAWTDLPLEAAIRDVGRKLEVPVWLDQPTLTEEGVALDQPITLSHSGISGRAVFELMLVPVQLQWVVEDEVLKITTSAKAGEKLETRNYDVSDLVAVQDVKGVAGADFTNLIDLLHESIEATSWERLGGYATVNAFRTGGIHVVSIRQTRWGHEEVVKLFADLRRHRRPGAVTIRTKLPEDPPESRSRPTAPVTHRFVNPRVDALVRGNNRFALELYGKLAHATTGNLLVSPYSISCAMAMVYAGARGETAREIAETMHVLLRQEDVPLAFAAMKSAGFSPGGETVATANGVWGQKEVPFLEPFRDTLRFQFAGGIEQIDFADAANAARTINAWTSRSTKGLISEVVAPRDFNDTTLFFITSAVSFNGKWSVPFRRESTKPAKFSTGKAEVEVPMMHLDSDTCRYAATDDLQILEKTYGEEEFSMHVLLPAKAPDTLAELESRLSEAQLTRWMGSQNSEKLEVYLPRFKVESALDLSDALKALGMKLAFEYPMADFSGICEKQRLALDKVLHKTYAEVDEEGTRATAVTGLGGIGGPPPKPPVFRADHPFIFLIRDNRTGAILFIGRMVNPGKQAQ